MTRLGTERAPTILMGGGEVDMPSTIVTIKWEVMYMESNYGNIGRAGE